MPMKKIKVTVENLLKTVPNTRDNDPLLYMMVAQELGIEYAEPYELLTKLSYQSVRAHRQNLQMNNEELRWQSYEKRQRHAGKKRQEFRQSYRQKLGSLFKIK